MKRHTRMALVLLTLTFCVGFDQATKLLAKSYLPKTKAVSFANDTFRLDYLENKGAVLSFEYYLPDHWRGPRVTVAVSAFLAVIIPYLLFGSRLQALPTFFLALFAGGAFSNMLDRVALGGNVVDFLNLGWGAYRTCIFNVADAAIVSGGGLFLLSSSWYFARLLARNGRRSVGRGSALGDFGA